MSNCIFCNISSGNIPADILYQDDFCIAFNDVNPVAPVHVLVIPRQHVSSLNELTDFDLAGKLLEICVKIACELGINESGYRVVINTGEAGGQSVPHLHVHLLGNRNLAWPPG